MSTIRAGPITAETALDDLMRNDTATIPIFIRRKMMSIGCPIARLHDVGEACRKHGVPLAGFFEEINAVAAERV